jgi:hypothetical protein
MHLDAQVRTEVALLQYHDVQMLVISSTTIGSCW